MNTIDKNYYPVIRSYIRYNYLGGKDTCTSICNYFRMLNYDIQKKTFEKMQTHSQDVDSAITKFLRSDKDLQIGYFKAWEEFLKYGVREFRDLKAMLIAFRIPGFELDDEKNSPIEEYFLGYYYSSFKYQLRTCLLRVCGENADLFYIDETKREYSGVIKGRSIELGLSEEDKHSKIILDKGINIRTEYFGGTWIKDHTPKGINYESMTYMLFQRLAVETGRSIYDYLVSSKGDEKTMIQETLIKITSEEEKIIRINKLYEITGWRFDRHPIIYSNDGQDNSDFFQKLIGKYELYELLLNRVHFVDQCFSRLIIEINESLEVKLLEEGGGARYGYLRKHPSNNIIMLYFPNTLDSTLKQKHKNDFLSITFRFSELESKKACYIGTITETNDSHTYAGAVYLKKNDTPPNSKKITLDEMFDLTKQNKESYPFFFENFLGKEERDREHVVASYTNLTEIKKMIEISKLNNNSNN